MSTLLLVLSLLATGVLAIVDTSNPLQDLSKSSCAPTSFSACAFRNVQLLVTQVLQDLNSSRFNGAMFQQVLALATSDPSAYRLGLGFAVTVFDQDMMILANGYNPSSVGMLFRVARAQEGIFTTPNLDSIFYEAAAAGGAWVNDVYYYYNGTVATNPTPRKTWVSGVFINGSLYAAASSFDDVDPQLIGRQCDGSLFADCSLAVASNLGLVVSQEVTGLLPSQSTAYWQSVSTAPLYSPPINFAVTIVRINDGVILAHSGAASIVGKTLESVSPGLTALLNSSILTGNTWVTYTWQEGGAPFQRQSQAFSALPVDGLTYFIFSGYGVTSQSKCPTCNCPVCTPSPPCPLCPAITDCDGTEVTNVKMDFKGLF